MRVTWAVTTIVLTFALLGMAWLNRTRVLGAVHDLDLSQGEVLLSVLRERFRDLPAPPDSATLDSLLVRHSHDSLRSIAFFSSRKRLLVRVGVPLSPEPVDLSPSDEPSLPVATGSGRMRIVGHYRPTREGADGAVAWGERAGGAVDTASLSSIVLEYDPLLSRDLLSDADRTFLLAGLACTVLFGVTLLFWRLSVRYELAQQRNEHARRLAVLGEMSAVLAHELRNPLASLKGNAQLLSGRLTHGSIEWRKAGLVIYEAERLEGLTSDLLEYVRSGSIDILPTNPVELVQACVDEVGTDAILVDATDAPPSWPLDPRRMRQAIVNLLRNAVQASPPDIRPTISVRQEGSSLVIAVQDAGDGIPPGDEERIFAPFFTTRVTGTGLGLAIARQIAEAHGGTVSAANSGGGALFRIVLTAVPPVAGGRPESSP